MSTFHRRKAKQLLLKLLKTGWQSWSTAMSKVPKFPLFNYLPQNKTHHFPLIKKFIGKLKRPSYGWCSWYAFGGNITENKILEQASWVKDNKQKYNLPLEYILIDDGWCTWGDWLEEDRDKFPPGLKKTAEKIKRLGLKPGIWIAPFLVDPKSRLAIEHPDWLVRKNGRLVEGLNLTTLDRFLPYKRWILNIKDPHVIKYLDDSIKYLVKDCGFELLKLDFLYGIFFDPNISGMEANTFLRNYLAKIRAKYPKIYTLACGCPIMPAVGVVDSMRIGPDTSVNPFLKFLLPKFFSRWYLNRRVIPTISKRLWTKKLWNVDPDAYLCREEVGFSHSQLLSFQSLIKRGEGNIFLGDDLTQLTPKRIKKYLYPLFR